MAYNFVLVHSPLIGPYSWRPVGSELENTGQRVVIPSLLAALEQSSGYANFIAEYVRKAVDGSALPEPLVLVGHSAAGAYLPVIGAELDRAVTAYVFVDARLPMRGTSLADQDTLEESVAVVRAAALLHDVSMFICDHAVHGQVSADMASEYLTERNFEPAFIKRVSCAIAEHGTDFGDLAPAEQGEQFSWEGKILIEADILDKLGASAITNALLYLGQQHKLNFEVRSELLEGGTFDRAVFFKDYFWTETGRRMAERRFTFLLQYLEQLGEEVVEADMPDWDD